MKFRTLGLAALAAAATLTTPAMAADQEHKTAAVTYRDLDLSSPEGQAELDRRIDRAAKSVCSFNEQKTGTRIRSNDARECYKEARRSLNKHLAAIVKQAQLGG